MCSILSLIAGLSDGTVAPSVKNICGIFDKYLSNHKLQRRKEMKMEYCCSLPFSVCCGRVRRVRRVHLAVSTFLCGDGLFYRA